MRSNAVVISIHPIYVERILSGEKRFEFRRSWAATPIDFLAIYATAPIKRIVAIAKVGRVIRASKTRLWELVRDQGAGISRADLFAYLEGRRHGVALELVRNIEVDRGIDLRTFFGEQFLPPQSFRYLRHDEFARLTHRVGGLAWA